MNRIKKKKVLLGALSIASIAGVAASITVPIINSKNTIKSSPIYFDGMKFDSIGDRNNYILANSEISDQDVVLDEVYYHTDENGKTVALNSNQVNDYKNYVNGNIRALSVYTSQNELINNTNADFGTISPEWYETSKPQNTKNISIFRGNRDAIYYNLDNAINSFMNAGYEFYYFNNIYFASKDELFNYLVDYYFNDSNNNNNSTKMFRIKGPRGKLSQTFDTSDEDWEVEAAKFILANCSKVLKVASDNGTIRYISLADKENAMKNISISDIPYVQIDSANGARNWYVDLNTEDKYSLDGPVYFNGFADLEGMNVKENWKIDKTNETTAIPYDTIFNETINKFFSSYFLDDVSFYSETGKTEDAKAISTTPILFSELFANKQLDTYESTTPEDLPYADELFKEFTIKGGLPSGADLTFSVDDFYSRLGVLNSSYLSNYSKSFMNFFDNSKYSYIYDEVVEIANNYRTSKNYNFLLKVPLLYYVMMDRLMVAGADQIYVDKTREYFKTIADTIQNLIVENLGIEAIKPAIDKQGFGDLNLAKIYNISIYNSEAIDFNLQEIWTNIKDNYPNLFLLSKMAVMLDGKKQTGQVVSHEMYEIMANSIVNSFLKDKSETVKNGCKESLLKSANHLIVKKPQIATSSTFYDSVNKQFRFTNIADFASYIMSVTYEDDTEVRDMILDNIMDQVNELMISKKSWSFVPDDNKFKIFAYILEKENDLKLMPQDFLNTINVFDYRSLLFWNNIFIQLGQTLGSSDKFNEYAKIWSEFNIESYDEVKDQKYDNTISNLTKRRNDEFYETFTGQEGHNNFSFVDGIVLDFPTYASITIMRMLADIAEENTLFINDNEEYFAKKINPQFKTQATLLVKEIFNDYTNNNFIPELANLYRGFQSIQESIHKNMIESLNTSTTIKLDIDDIADVIKNTAQYSSIINQNFNYLKDKLKKIGINTRKGQIIAYSGSTNIENTYREYDSGINKFNDIYQDGWGVNDHVALVTDITDDRGNKLDTYVIPDMEINSSIINYDNIYFANSIYTIPANAYDFDSINHFNFSFNKYFDLGLLSELGIDTSNLVKTKDGLTLYYNPSYKYDSKYVDLNNEYYFKKWGNWISETKAVSSFNVSNVSSVFAPYRLGEINKIPRAIDIEKMSFKSDALENYDIEMVKNVTYYEGKGRNLSGWDMQSYPNIDPRFFNRLTSINRELIKHANKMADFYEHKYYNNANISGNDFELSNLVLEDIDNQTLTALATAYTPRKISETSDIVSLSTKNGENVLQPTKEFIEDETNLRGKNKKPKSVWYVKIKDDAWKKQFSKNYTMPERYMSAFLPDYENLAIMLSKGELGEDFISAYKNFATKWYVNEINPNVHENWYYIDILEDPYLRTAYEEHEINPFFPEDLKLYKDEIDYICEASAERFKNVYSDTSFVDSYMDENYRWGHSPQKIYNVLEAEYFRHKEHLGYVTEYKTYKKELKSGKNPVPLINEFETNGKRYRPCKIVNKKYMNQSMIEARNLHKFLVTLMIGDANSWNSMGMSELYRFRLMNKHVDNYIEHYKNFYEENYHSMKKSERKFVKAQIKYYESFRKHLFDEKKQHLNMINANEKMQVSSAYRKNFKFLLGFHEIYNNTFQPRINGEWNAIADSMAKKDRIVSFSESIKERIDTSIVSDKDNYNFIDITPGSDMPQMVLNSLTSVGSSTSLVNDGIVVNTADSAAIKNKKYNPLDKKIVTKNENFSKNPIYKKKRDKFKKIINNWDNYKAKHSTFFTTMGFFGQIFNIVGFATSIYTLVSMSIMHKKEFSYTYETPEATWSWNGGEMWNNMWGNINITRDIDDMKLNKPILINNSYDRNYKYFNGKLYSDDNELKNDFVDFIMNSKNDVSNFQHSNCAIGYTFRDFDVVNVNEINENDSTYFYDTDVQLKEAVLESIKSPNDSPYVEDLIHNYSDKAYDVDWSSLNSDAAKVQAAQSLIQNIRPTFVSLIPSVVENDFSTRYAINRRELTVLPGNSWDPINERVVTWEEKVENNQSLPANMNEMFMIDNSANNVNENGFLYTSTSDIKDVLNSHKLDVRMKIADMIQMFITPNYSGLDKEKKFTDVVKRSRDDENRVEPFKVYSYYDNSSSIVYFVDSFDKNGNILRSALENLTDYVYQRNNISKSFIKQNTKFIKYKGEYFKNIDEVVKRYN